MIDVSNLQLTNGGGKLSRQQQQLIISATVLDVNNFRN